MRLTREHLGRIIRLDVPTVPEIHEGEFRMGDIMVLFNNTDQFTTLMSKVSNSFRSGMAARRQAFEVPPRALVNIIFVADDVMVVTVGT